MQSTDPFDPPAVDAAGHARFDGFGVLAAGAVLLASVLGVYGGSVFAYNSTVALGKFGGGDLVAGSVGVAVTRAMGGSWAVIAALIAVVASDSVWGRKVRRRFGAVADDADLAPTLAALLVLVAWPAAVSCALVGAALVLQRNGASFRTAQWPDATDLAFGALGVGVRAALVAASWRWLGRWLGGRGPHFVFRVAIAWMAGGAFSILGGAAAAAVARLVGVPT